MLIYFDQETKAGIFDRLARMLEPDGVLLFGAANPWSGSPTPSSLFRTGAGFTGSIPNERRRTAQRPGLKVVAAR